MVYGIRLSGANRIYLLDISIVGAQRRLHSLSLVHSRLQRRAEVGLALLKHPDAVEEREDVVSRARGLGADGDADHFCSRGRCLCLILTVTSGSL